MKNLILTIIILGLGTQVIAQDVHFSFAVLYSGNTTEVQIYAEKVTPGTENMAGFTVNFYYDNTETTLTSFNTSPATSLGWNVSESSALFVNNSNPTVTTTHTGYGTINIIDQNIVGTDIGTSPVHILSLNFDNSIGDPNDGGDGFFAGTSNNHPAQEYVGIDFLGHPVLIIGPQSEPLSLGALPVELTYFQARPTDEKWVELTWETASEDNNAYFDIERSADGLNFTSIAQVEGFGTSYVSQTYLSYDERPLPGINYYRLKQVDIDGSFEYSDIKSVTFSKLGSKLSLYPNPSSGIIYFKEPLNGQIVIRNLLGQVVWQSNGEALQSLNLMHLSTGKYCLQYIDEQEKMQTIKFVITKP